MSTLKVVPDPSWTDRVAEEVRVQMTRARMTQVQLAEILDLPQTSVSMRLRGKTPFRVDELGKVADALGVHPAVFLGVTPPAGGDGGPGAADSQVTRRSPDNSAAERNQLTTGLVDDSNDAVGSGYAAQEAA